MDSPNASLALAAPTSRSPRPYRSVDRATRSIATSSQSLARTVRHDSTIASIASDASCATLASIGGNLGTVESMVCSATATVVSSGVLRSVVQRTLGGEPHSNRRVAIHNLLVHRQSNRWVLSRCRPGTRRRAPMITLRCLSLSTRAFVAAPGVLCLWFAVLSTLPSRGNAERRAPGLSPDSGLDPAFRSSKA